MERHSDATTHPSAPPTQRDAGADVIRLTAGQLRALPGPDARLCNAVAFVLTRVADADECITSEEASRMESILADCSRLTPAQAALVSEIATHRARLADVACSYGESRHLRRVLDATQRHELLESLHSVASADGELSTEERATILQVAAELGFTRAEIAAADPFGDA